MAIDTTYLRRCIRTLEVAFEHLRGHDSDDVAYDIYRAACVKEFEIVLEQSGSLLRKRLRAWLASNREADRLTFKNLFRHAARHCLISADACERWLKYRDNRNDTAHDYGNDFAEATLKLLPESWRMRSSSPPRSRSRAMTERLHLLPRHRVQLDRIVRWRLPDVEIWVYGSRINGRSHDGSDLDLVLRAPDLQPIPAERMAEVVEALRESTIPFPVDVRDWARVPEYMRREIDRDHVVLK